MRIPRTLDRPTRFLGIPFDLVIVCVAIYYLFMIFDWGAVGIPLSIIGANIYSRFRSKSFFRNIQRFIYWYFPAELSKRTGILGHQRRVKFK